MVSEILPELIISEYILEKRTLPACPAEFLEIRLTGNQAQDSTANVQLKCESFPFAKTKVSTALVRGARILVPGGEGSDEKRILEVSFDVKDISGFDYAPGDTIGVLTTNSTSDVNLVLEATQLSAPSSDEICEISIRADNKKKTAKVPIYIPAEFTPRSLIRDCLNIKSVPKKLFIRALAEYTTTAVEKEFLETLSSKEGAAHYTVLTSSFNLTFLQLLQICPSCHPPLSLLIEHLPRLLPRPYSIANSPLTTPNEVKVIFSVWDSNPGLTTKMLEDLVLKFIEKSDDSPLIANIFLREPNNFRYTEEDLSKNVIMISIGCGVSPFLGFIEHKEALSKDSKATNHGETWLFTGHRCHDNSIYRERLQQLEMSRILTKLFESFSRQENSNHKYVQDQIRENETEFVNLLINENTVLYLCADGAQISKDIENCIKSSLQNVLGIDENEVGKFILEYKKNGKYREDIWN